MEVKERLQTEELDAELLKEAIRAGFSLTDIAKIREVSVSWISKQAKEFGVQAPRPGHRNGQMLTEKHKENIQKALDKKNK